MIKHDDVLQINLDMHAVQKARRATTPGVLSSVASRHIVQAVQALTDLQNFSGICTCMPWMLELFCIVQAELHLHIEGTLEPELMIQIAKRNDVLESLPFQTADAAREAYRFQNLQGFLDCTMGGAACSSMSR